MAPPPQEPRRPLSGKGPVPGGSAPLDAVKELSRQVEELSRQLAALTETVRREHDRAAHREQVIDRLHAVNQQLRFSLVQEALTPVRAGLYRLYDTVAREAARWQGPDRPDGELTGPLLAALADDVAEVLGRAGAERISVKPGDPYDAALHRPVGTVSVASGEDGTVVEVQVDGFAMGERALRKASVLVGRAAPGDGATPGVEGAQAGDANGQEQAQVRGANGQERTQVRGANGQERTQVRGVNGQERTQVRDVNGEERAQAREGDGELSGTADGGGPARDNGGSEEENG